MQNLKRRERSDSNPVYLVNPVYQMLALLIN
jgi:hypothetical protein